MDYLNPTVYFDFPRWRIATARLPARMAQRHRLYISGLWTLINPYTFAGGLGDILRFARTSKSIWKYGASNFDGFFVFEILWKVQVPGYARCSDAPKYSNHYYCCWLFKNYFIPLSAQSGWFIAPHPVLIAQIPFLDHYYYYYVSPVLVLKQPW